MTNNTKSDSENLEPIGYSKLILAIKKPLFPHFRLSFIAPQGRGYIKQTGNQLSVVYAKGYRLQNPENLFENLEFALKHDGINLSILFHLFKLLSPQEVADYITNKTTSKYSRKIWFLYEKLMNVKLNLPDLKNVAYVNLLDEKLYYTGNTVKEPRHAINNNLLGNFNFCPFVRKTKELLEYEKKNLNEQAKNLLLKVDPAILVRATNYLYTKETKSSFGIEKVKPDRKRLDKFINLLEQIPELGNINKNLLILLQNNIVEDLYQDNDYRKAQNYVGELTSSYEQKIHYISPKPEDLNYLMDGFIEVANTLFETNAHPVVIASCLAFSFVFLHPFEDGNGRIHRFLIHYALAKTGYTPHQFIFPVSSVMLKNLREYDQQLESFSIPLLSIIDNYDLNEQGELKVECDTKIHYQYVDYTEFAVYLFKCIEKTIEDDFQKELKFIEQYDKTKQAIQAIIDMPDLKIDRIIRCISQNNGQLGKKMRHTFFQELTDETIREIEKAIKLHMQE